MKKYLNITNLKILTILIGLIATITLLENSLQIFRIQESTYDSRVAIHNDVAKLFFCWCPYFFFKVLENKWENLFKKIGLTLNEDDK